MQKPIDDYVSTITIRVVVDVVRALAEGTLDGCLFLIDNRGGRGSRDENTDRLQTAVGRSDKKIIWVSSPIECEVSCELTRVEMRTAGDLYRLEKKTYNGTNQPYWVAHVMAPPRDAEYRLVLTLGENIEMASTRAMLVKAESKSAS